MCVLSESRRHSDRWLCGLRDFSLFLFHGEKRKHKSYWVFLWHSGHKIYVVRVVQCCSLVHYQCCLWDHCTHKAAELRELNGATVITLNRARNRSCHVCSQRSPRWAELLYTVPDKQQALVVLVLVLCCYWVRSDSFYIYSIFFNLLQTNLWRQKQTSYVIKWMTQCFPQRGALGCHFVIK